MKTFLTVLIAAGALALAGCDEVSIEETEPCFRTTKAGTAEVDCE